MAYRKNGVSKDALNTVVGIGSVLEGQFEVREGIRVDGTLKGTLMSSGMLVVGTSGLVEADIIRVKEAHIAGRVKGNVEAEFRVKLESSAEVIGDIRAQVLVIEEGAVFKGICDAGDGGGMPLLGKTQVDGKVVEVPKAVGS
ncbi:MAG: polymer-forming cytoskeletal protein [bacterium]|nr:polymer-forming cytoskeletal protein [bacterium]